MKKGWIIAGISSGVVIVVVLSVTMAIFFANNFSHGFNNASEQLQGTWYAEDAAGHDSTIEFKKDFVSIDGEDSDYQTNGTGFKNSARYVEIKQNSEQYTVVFPEGIKGNAAVIMKPSDDDEPLVGKMLFAMNRKTTPDYYEYADRYLNR